MEFSEMIYWIPLGEERRGRPRFSVKHTPTNDPQINYWTVTENVLPPKKVYQEKEIYPPSTHVQKIRPKQISK
jgi:hypothetical protein